MNIKCDQPGCDFVAHHHTPYVKCIIARHKSIKHGIKGTSAAARSAQKKKAQREVLGIPGTEAPAPEQVVPNFCPNCGCSIKTIMVAMNLRRRS